MGARSRSGDGIPAVLSGVRAAEGEGGFGYLAIKPASRLPLGRGEVNGVQVGVR